MTNKEERENMTLQYNKRFLTAQVPCKSCNTPTERQILVHGDCPPCRAYDSRRAKEDNDPQTSI